MPFTRTAKRSATRSSHPQRRSRPGHGAELLADLADALVRRSLDLARERPLADPGHVRLGDAENLVDAVGADPEADRRPGRDRARGRDERVRAVVEVEQRPLRSLEEDAVAALERAMRRGATYPRRRAPASRRSAGGSPPPLRRRGARARRRARARRSSPRRRARASGAGSSRRGGPGRGSRFSWPCPRRPDRFPGASFRSAGGRAGARARRRAPRARA